MLPVEMSGIYVNFSLEVLGLTFKPEKVKIIYWPQSLVMCLSFMLSGYHLQCVCRCQLAWLTFYYSLPLVQCLSFTLSGCHLLLYAGASKLDWHYTHKCEQTTLKNHFKKPLTFASCTMSFIYAFRVSLTFVCRRQ